MDFVLLTLHLLSRRFLIYLPRRFRQRAKTMARDATALDFVILASKFYSYRIFNEVI